MFRKKEKGFTLIELLVVIAIIGLLSSVVMASLNSARVKSRDAKRAAEMRSAVQALQMYYIDNGGRYPAAVATADPQALCGTAGNCLATIMNTYLVPRYIATAPADPTYVNQGANYRYCGGGGNTYAIVRWSEENAGWCRPQLPFTYPTSCGWDTAFPQCD